MLVLSTGDNSTIEGTVSADLTGATARVNIKRPDYTVVSKTATFGDRTAGEWAITYTDEDFPDDGTHSLEVEVTFSSGEVQTFAYSAADNRRLQFRVRKQIA